MRDIRFEARSLEIRLRKLFKRTENYKQLLTYGGIFTKENILDEGGFYIVLISTLTQYYLYENSSRIDGFIENLQDIKKAKLEELSEEKIEEIMNELTSIVKQ
ncbi:hypothetical protein FDF86_06250 [Clostridium botulinum]|nr:hypothetical protein [Clostridium botulinum]